VTVPLVGSASRAISFTNVDLPEPVSPTTATDSPRESSGRRRTTHRRRSLAQARRTGRSPGRRPAPRPGFGSITSIGSSSRSRILRHPAIAVCV
jgi:hypothetical protein